MTALRYGVWDRVCTKGATELLPGLEVVRLPSIHSVELRDHSKPQRLASSVSLDLAEFQFVCHSFELLQERRIQVELELWPPGKELMYVVGSGLKNIQASLKLAHCIGYEILP